MNQNVLYAIERGLKYENGQIIGVRGCALKPNRTKMGYYQVAIPKIGGGFTNVLEHKLIFYFETGDERAFHPDYNVHHVDRDRSNNDFANLQLMGKHEHHSMEAELTRNACKLSLTQVAEVRTRYAQGGVTQRQLGKDYGVTQAQISKVVQGKNWK